MNKKTLASNMVANLIAFGLSMAVSFFLSPYIVRTLGKEANGFISLINNFIAMSQIVTVAVNSMGARFITIAIHRKEEEKAKKYFSSLFFANLVMSAILLLIFCVVSVKVDSIFKVPESLVTDVRITFLIASFTFSMSLLFSVYSVATYTKNRLDLSAFRDMVKQVIRALTVLVLFCLLKPTIIYVTFAAFLAEVYYTFTNYRLTKKLLPGFKVSKHNFSFIALKELISAGIWNSIGKLSYVLLGNLDLMVANLFISAAAMGVLSVSKTIPASISSLTTTIVAVFLPTFTIDYAKRKIDVVLSDMWQAIKIIGIIIAPVLCFLMAYGQDFYALWQPTLDARELQLLSILAILPLYFTLGMKSVGSIFAITNKLKFYTIAVLITSLTTITIEFSLLKFTSLGLIAISATSSICLIIQDFTFTPIYAARCLKVKWYTFYPNLFKEIIIVLISIAVSLLLHSLMPANTWLKLIVYGGITSVIIVILNVLLLFNKKDYNRVITRLIAKKGKH